MSNGKEKLNFEQEVKASPAQVYRAFTNSSALQEWMCDLATTDPKPGGRFYMWWNSGYYTSGEFNSLDENKSFSFKWVGRGEPGPTQVDVMLQEKNMGTQISLIHSGISSGTEWEGVVEEYKKGWKNGLENLVSVLESGEDLRFVRRPMLGIGANVFDKEIAETLGVPVVEGIRIDSTLSGMGAEAAGLEKDDVIVNLAGTPQTDGASYSNALSGYHAGDTIDVTFYRGPEKKSVKMTLSGRPIPEIPETGKALSEAVRENYDEVLSQIKDFLNNISEEEASFKPSDDEWSVKETIAHLIITERGWHTFIQDLLADFESKYDGYGGNIQARIKAMVIAYPFKQQLLDELERSVEVILAMLANLPDEFYERKSSYWRLGNYLLQAPYHFNGHLDQMRSAAEATRSH